MKKRAIGDKIIVLAEVCPDYINRNQRVFMRYEYRVPREAIFTGTSFRLTGTVVWGSNKYESFLKDHKAIKVVRFKFKPHHNDKVAFPEDILDHPESFRDKDVYQYDAETGTFQRVKLRHGAIDGIRRFPGFDRIKDPKHRKEHRVKDNG